MSICEVSPEEYTSAMQFYLAHTRIICPCAPWAAQIDEQVVLTIPTTVEERMHFSKDIGSPSSQEEAAQKRRMLLWGVIKMAVLGTISDDVLFRSTGRGRCFTLHSPSPSRVPLQRIHIGPYAIPEKLADTPCNRIHVKGFLRKLNEIHATNYTLNIPGLRNCLEHVLQSCEDFGQAYGTIRPWWQYKMTRVLDAMTRREKTDYELRSGAVRGSCIQDADIPPRRVWDLWSNRVLPFHCSPTESSSGKHVPDNLWTISHSWVAAKERQEVWTRVNGCLWPVPIPSATTLSHLRIELLNMGAEYVWLDVLCLRQKGRDEDEVLRREEWKLDVPTIGCIYHRGPITCVTYFNGLGIPFETSQGTLQSDRHWFNRVWTVQEACRCWLPGGITGEITPDAPSLFARLESLRKQGTWDISSLLNTMISRSCTTELDRIAGLAYLLDCPTLPIYDEDVSVEDAWTLLIKHLPPWLRAGLFLEYPALPPDSLQLWISWKQVTSHFGSHGGYDGFWHLADRSRFVANLHK